MKVTTDTRNHPYCAASRDGDLHFRLVAALCFMPMFAVAVIARISNWRWQPWPPGRNGYRSAYREALNASRTAAAIALSV
jgi:hypothetical protein